MIPELMSDAEWQAEADADALMQASEIKSDPARLAAAKEAAERKAMKMREDAKRYSSFAGKTSSGLKNARGGRKKSPI